MTRAIAQTAPTTPTPPKPDSSNTVQGVTVTGTPPPVRASIDRRSYDITKDLQATTGTVADALRNVPSVSVDLQGNVSIRGDSNVVVMVDGKPSTQFQGPGRATALQSLPADEFERVEVITNPSAALSPEGTGGVINLISKKTRKPGRSGVLRANVDPTGRWNTALSASQKTEKLTLTLTAGVRHELYAETGSDAREGFAGAGGPAFTSFETEHAAGGQYSWNLRGGFDYESDAATRLSGAVHANGWANRNRLDSETIGHDSAGQLDLVFNRPGRIFASGGDGGVDASLRRTFGREDHDLNLSLVVDRSRYDDSFPYADVSQLPASPEVFDNRLAHDVFTLTDAKADYERPTLRQGKLKAGYELKVEDDAQSQAGFLGAPSPAGPFDPGQADAFHFDRWINAVYATYEQPIAKVTTLAGLRLERTDLSLDDRSGGVQARTHDLHAYTTLHLAYTLTSDQQLLASYSGRVQRPSPSDLNPYRFIYGPFQIRQGNPDLRPQQTQSFELAWDYKHRTDYLRAGLFYKINRGGVADAVTDLGNNVFLYTRENLVSSRNGGAELEANGQFGRTLTYNLSGNLLWTQTDASSLGLITPRSLVTAAGHGSFTWQPRPNDTFQLYLSASGRTLTGEGYLRAWSYASLGYRHKFDDRLSLFTTLQDVFDTAQYGQVIVTPALVDRSSVSPHHQILYLGLAYSFGGAPKRDQDIELGAPGGGAAP